MKEACKFLVGSHDFRNLCKMDVGNGVVTYIRHIEAANIFPTTENDDEPSPDSAYKMYYLQISANAFLWHQIRCIVALLMLVGNAKESPDVIKDLLDVDENEQ